MFLSLFVTVCNMKPFFLRVFLAFSLIFTSFSLSYYSHFRVLSQTSTSNSRDSENKDEKEKKNYSSSSLGTLSESNDGERKNTALTQGQETSSSEFEWPIRLSPYNLQRKFSSTFGETRLTHFHNGVDISSNNELIYPIANGDFLYTKQRSDNPFEPMLGTGNYVFLKHSRKRQSGYYHLKESSAFPRLGKVKKNTPFALSGNTGASKGAHLHFFIIEQNIEENKIELLNPLALLPKLEDTKAPDISTLLIRTMNSYTSLLPDGLQEIRLTHSFPVFLKTTDTIVQSGINMGPYKISWQINAKKEQRFVFDRIQYRVDKWELYENLFSQVFDQKLYQLLGIEFEQGLNMVYVTVEDFSGNTSKKIFRIKVNRNYSQENSP